MDVLPDIVIEFHRLSPTVKYAFSVAGFHIAFADSGRPKRSVTRMVLDAPRLSSDTSKPSQPLL